MSSYIAVALLSLLSVGTAALGVFLATLIRDNGTAIALGIGFSAGIMVLVSTLELIPESDASIGLPATALTVCAGAGALWIANLAIPHSHLVREHGLADTRLVSSVYLVVMGLILHDVPEGFAMANSYIADPSLGLLVALAIAMHNLPEEMAMALPAMTLHSRKFLIGAAILSALAEPAGAIIGLLAVKAIADLNAYFISVAAGAMLFVSLHELLPMARRYGHVHWFSVGLLFSVVVHQAIAAATA